MPRCQVSCELICEPFLFVSMLDCLHVENLLSVCFHFPVIVWYLCQKTKDIHTYFNCCILHIITHQVIYVGYRVSIFVETGSVASSDI